MADKPKAVEKPETPEEPAPPNFADFVDLLVEWFVFDHERIHRAVLPKPGDDQAITRLASRLKAFRNLGISE